MSRPLCPRCGKPVTRNGLDHGHAGWRCSKRRADPGCGWAGTAPTYAPKALGTTTDRVSEAQRLIITAAQNATPIHKAFWLALQRMAEDRNATIVVVPYRYHNPTSMWSEAADDDDWWAPELAPHLVDQRLDLGDSLTLLADIKTQPTATRPLAGFETITGPRSGIFGHPRLELVCVPTPQQRLPKILTTTGAVTLPNYIRSKAGAKGEHHHTFGACYVEREGDAFHLRQINATADGSFCDLTDEYSARGVKRDQRAAALVMGDSHIEFIDPTVVDATFGAGGMIDVLRPHEVVWHDVHDFYSRNHHHRGEPFINYVKHHTGRSNVERALDETFAFIDSVTRPGTRNVFVPSNHPDALARWVKETDPRTDPENALFWAKTFTAMCEGASWAKTGARTIDPFAYWARQKLKTAAQATFLARDESHQIHDIEVGYHGDRGPNGSRGSIGGFGRIGTKTVVGHSHTPGVRDGVYQVGTSSFYGLEYASGPSSWLQTHCAIYQNGKRSLLNIIAGRWRGLGGQHADRPTVRQVSGGRNAARKPLRPGVGRKAAA